MQVIKDQYIFKFSKDNEPIAHATDGEVLRFLTRDCFNCQITSEEQTMETIDFEACNPATGPVFVENAEPGDVLAVDILDISVADHGVVATVKGFGVLSERGVNRTKILPVRDGYVHFNDIKFPAVPMIGVIGTASDEKTVISGFSFNGGGNMDSRKITKGTTVYFPVRVPGALLAMGDVHAAMGDGEVCETGVEINADILVRVRVIKHFKLNWPVTETDDVWFVNTNGVNCDVAIQRGYEEMLRLVSNAYGWDITDSTMYLSLQALVEANQAVLDPNETDDEGPVFRVGVPKLASKPRLIP
ncbi:MAG: acetamidase/formamidase family protein [Oscillospiraceae bacterium]|nr:acetamidase/formamidase family protein [Oscillospiraceae bacterium]